MTIDAPNTWQSKEMVPVSSVGPLPQPVLIKKGEKHEIDVDLFDFFQEIPSGSARLKVNIKVWSAKNTSELLADFHRAVTINISAESDKELESRIARMLHGLGTAERDARAEIYRQALAIRSPKTMPILIKGLSDPAAWMLLNEINSALGNMSEPDNMTPLVDYLAESGSRYHQYIFSIWKNRHIQITDEQYLKLRSARNPWIQLFLIDLHPNQMDDDEIKRIESEIEQLGEALAEVKRASQNPNQSAEQNQE